MSTILVAVPAAEAGSVTPFVDRHESVIHDPAINKASKGTRAIVVEDSKMIIGRTGNKMEIYGMIKFVNESEDDYKGSPYTILQQIDGSSIKSKYIDGDVNTVCITSANIEIRAPLMSDDDVPSSKQQKFEGNNSSYCMVTFDEASKKYELRINNPYGTLPPKYTLRAFLSIGWFLEPESEE